MLKVVSETSQSSKLFTVSRIFFLSLGVLPALCLFPRVVDLLLAEAEVDLADEGRCRVPLLFFFFSLDFLFSFFSFFFFLLLSSADDDEDSLEDDGDLPLHLDLDGDLVCLLPPLQASVTCPESPHFSQRRELLSAVHISRL